MLTIASLLQIHSNGKDKPKRLTVQLNGSSFFSFTAEWKALSFLKGKFIFGVAFKTG